MSKQLQPSEKIVESLLKLKEELWKHFGNDQGGTGAEIAMKINSCLYTSYPVVKDK